MELTTVDCSVASARADLAGIERGWLWLDDKTSPASACNPSTRIMSERMTS
jgi:hypothetical protein